MALYPLPANDRVAYDRDGSALFVSDGSSVLQATTAQAQAVNDESDSTLWTPSLSLTGGTCWIGLLSPERRALTGEYIRLTGGTITPGLVEYSFDSTDGINGTWNLHSATWTNSPGGSTAWRANATSHGGTNAQAIRFKFTATSQPSIVSFHTYVSASYATIDLDGVGIPRLRIQQAGGAVPDWGDTPRGSTAVRPFVVSHFPANAGTSGTAHNVLLALEALTDPLTPSILGQFLFSASSSGPWTSTLTISSVSYGTPATFYVQRVTPTNQPLGPGACRITATAASFT